MSDQDLAAVNDIFQDSDDESTGRAAPATTTAARADLDDIFGDSTDRGSRAAAPKAGTLSGLFDSDDEEEDKPTTKKRLTKGDDLFDSDDDGSEADAPKKRKRLGMKKKRQLQDSDDEDNEDGDNPFKKKKLEKKREKKREKKQRPQREKPARSADGSATGVDQGDEYDSGNERPRTKDDDDFLSGESDDDNAAVVREYDQDNQDFDDDRPRKSAAAKKVGGAATASSSSGGKSGGNDPFSVALANLKAKKVEQWSDMEKQAYVDRLNIRMREACKRDDDIMVENRKRAGMAPPQPALHKLEMLETVKHALSMAMLWHTMMERDMLITLGYWIRPRSDQSLPALSIRSAIYEALLKLPCMPDHLKKSSMVGEVPIKPIGHIIFELVKHKQETPENKKLLRTIVDKWSRDIFSKGTEVVQSLAAYRNDAEIHARLASKYDSASQARLKEEEEAKYKKENHQRARAPMILGHMFTVQPDIDKKALQRARNKAAANKEDEAIEVADTSSGGGGGSGGDKNGKNAEGSRASLLKRMEGGARGGGAAGGGAKRAVSVSVARPAYDFH
eukprot:gene15105-10807_t